MDPITAIAPSQSTCACNKGESAVGPTTEAYLVLFYMTDTLFCRPKCRYAVVPIAGTPLCSCPHPVRLAAAPIHSPTSESSSVGHQLQRTPNLLPAVSTPAGCCREMTQLLPHLFLVSVPSPEYHCIRDEVRSGDPASGPNSARKPGALLDSVRLRQS